MHFVDTCCGAVGGATSSAASSSRPNAYSTKLQRMSKGILLTADILIGMLTTGSTIQLVSPPTKTTK